MAEVAHSIASVISRHPLHGIQEFATDAQRNAHAYTAKDVGKCVKVTSPLKYWLIVSQSNGVATFREIAPDIASFIAHAFGSTAGSICAGNDPRLGDARTPTAHGNGHRPGGADALPTAIAVATAPGGSCSEGTALAYARSDHQHALAPFGSTAGTFCEGNDPRLGGMSGPHASTHLPGGSDALTTAAAGTSAPGDSASEGAASSYARSDHKHALPAFGTTVATFCEGNDARLSDPRTPSAHVSTHLPGGADALPTAAAALITPGDGAGEGSASSYAKSDHKHALPAFGTAAGSFCEGSDARLSDARTPSAHVSTHLPGGADALPTAAAAAITPGDGAGAGSASSYAKSDHKHALPAFGAAAGTFCEGSDSRLSDARMPTAHASLHLPGGPDALPTAAAGAITPGDGAGAGSASSYAKSDHKHALPAFGASAATFCEGNDLRLSDQRTPCSHVSSHLPSGADGLPTAAPARGIGSGNAMGSADSYARSDHDHSLRETSGPTDLGLGAIVDGQFLKRSGASIVSVPLPTTKVWVPDARPLAPSANDDEFDGAEGAALNPAWSEWDVPGIVSPDLDGQGRMRMQIPTGARRMVGIYRPVPTETEYAIYTRTHFRSRVNGGGGATCGIFLAEDLATSPSTADIRLLCANLGSDNSEPVVLFSLPAFNGAPVTIDAMPATVVTSMYFRVRVNGVNYGVDFSTDGVSWMQVFPNAGSNNLTPIGITPVHMGFGGWNNAAGRDVQVLCDFFRVVTGPGSSSLYRNDLGRELSLPYM